MEIRYKSNVDADYNHIRIYKDIKLLMSILFDEKYQMCHLNQKNIKYIKVLKSLDVVHYAIMFKNKSSIKCVINERSIHFDGKYRNGTQINLRRRYIINYRDFLNEYKNN